MRAALKAALSAQEPSDVYHARIALELDDETDDNSVKLTEEQRMGLLETIWEHYR